MPPNVLNYESSPQDKGPQMNEQDEQDQIAENINPPAELDGLENMPASNTFEEPACQKLIDNFVDNYPEFAHLPQNAIGREFKQSELMLSQTAWGKWFQMAQEFWCAHNLALQWNISDACAKLGKRSPYDVSAVTSQTASTTSLSQSMSPPELLKSDDPTLLDFLRTSYGMRYLNLLYTVIPAGEVVHSSDSSGG